MQKRRAGQVKFDSPEFTAALTKFKTLVDKGLVDKRGLSRNYAQTQQAFLDGKGGMYPMGTWFVAAAKDATFDVGYFPFPSDDGSLKLPTFTGGGLTVNAKSKHLAEAKKFALTWSATQAINDAGVKADALFPAIKGYTFPSDVSPLFKDTFKTYQDAAKGAQTVPAFSWEAGDDAALPGLVDKFNAGAQDLITGKQSVQEVLQGWDKAWDTASK
jgi:multiple sugar transport system substrate-binding protein